MQYFLSKHSHLCQEIYILLYFGLTKKNFQKHAFDISEGPWQDNVTGQVR